MVDAQEGPAKRPRSRRVGPQFLGGGSRPGGRGPKRCPEDTVTGKKQEVERDGPGVELRGWFCGPHVSGEPLDLASGTQGQTQSEDRVLKRGVASTALEGNTAFPPKMNTNLRRKVLEMLEGSRR